MCKLIKYFETNTEIYNLNVHLIHLGAGGKYNIWLGFIRLLLIKQLLRLKFENPFKKI